MRKGDPQCFAIKPAATVEECGVRFLGPHGAEKYKIEVDGK
jgi:hypothetical protein